MQPSVLIVDRDADLLMSLGFILEDAGFDALMAPDAAAAVNLAERRHPDAIVVELELDPHRASLCRDLQAASGRDAPCLVTTAAAHGSGARERARDMGATELLDKPLDEDELVAALRRALGAR